MTSEGVDDFRKNYPADWFQGNSCHTIGFVCQGKKSVTRGLGKKFLHAPKPNHPYPPQKSNGHPLKKNWTKTRRTITKKAKGLK